MINLTNETKEILEALKPQDEEFTKAGIKEYPLYLSRKQQDLLLDYITNLQNGFKSTVEELCETTEKLEELELKHKQLKDLDKIQKAYKELQEENEILKKDIEAMRHNYNLLVRLIENGESMTQKFENGLTYQDYKSRNEKAIYYIWKEIEQEYDEENNKWLKEKIDNLKNILNGDKDE